MCGVPHRPPPAAAATAAAVATAATADGVTPTVASAGLHPGGNPGMIELEMGRLGQWTRVAIASGLLRGYFTAEEPSVFTADVIVQLGKNEAAAIELAALSAEQ